MSGITQKELVVGNTKVLVTEENGVVKVHLDSEDAVVYMNNEIIWSTGNEKEEFKYIPQQLHKFILDTGSDYIEYSPQHKETVVDVYPGGQTLTMYIPQNKRKQIQGRVDFIRSVEDVVNYLKDVEDEKNVSETINELKVRFDETIKFIESKGYKFEFSHAVDEWAYAWWDIIFSATSFNEESIREIMEKLKEFDKFINDIRDKYDNRL
jgi:transcriptional regulator with PAS, ATPase and Fis domain